MASYRTRIGEKPFGMVQGLGPTRVVSGDVRWREFWKVESHPIDHATRDEMSRMYRSRRWSTNVLVNTLLEILAFLCLDLLVRLHRRVVSSV